MAVARPEILATPAELGARRVALDFLADVRAARDRLDDPDDTDALHDFRVALRRLRSWLRAFRPQLRDTLRGKTERRLERIADVTGTSRDLEVHIGWLKQIRRRIPERGRPGAEWLLRRLHGSKKDADAELRDVIDSDFAKAIRRSERALEQYTARVADDGPRFGDMASALVGRQAGAFLSAMRVVSAQGDRAEAHAARIETKRLRYALEGLSSLGIEVHSIPEELKQLQDTLGELHDAQQFGSELATMIAELIAERQHDQPQSGTTHRHAAKADPVVGLQTMLKDLRRTEGKAFRRFERSWKKTKRIEEITSLLATIGGSLR